MLEAIVERHADEAAFLWEQRARAVRSLLFDLSDLCALDERLLANLEGLVLAGGRGLEIALHALERASRSTTQPDAELFAAAHTAAELGENLAFSRLLVLAQGVPRRERAIAAALSWLPVGSARRMLDEMLAPGGPPLLQRIALLASQERGEDPGAALAAALAAEDAELRAIACRAAGRLGRRDLVATLRLAAGDPDPAVTGWARWALGIFGDPSGLTRLWDTAATGEGAALASADLAARLGPPAETAARLAALAASERTLPAALAGAAAAGDPACLSWVLDAMERPGDHSRAAAWVYAMITGVRIEPPLFVRGRPSAGGREEGEMVDPTPAPPDPSQPTADADLPTPAVEQVRAHWDLVRPGFSGGQRYLGGSVHDAAALRRLLRKGPQGFREWAALELQRASAGAALFPVAAPGPLQTARLRATEL